MDHVQVDPLMDSLETLERALAADFHDREPLWTDEVHSALGRVATALQDQVQGANKSTEAVGAANPEVRAVPTVERQIRQTREQQVNLGERIYQLRARLRNAGDSPDELNDLRAQAQDLVTTIEKVRLAKIKSLLEALNSNPGAGD